MNGLIAKTQFGTLWGEKMPILDYVYGIIDSKIDFIELKTRRILEKFRTVKVEGTHRTDSSANLPSMSDLYIDNSVNELLFQHFEKLSRSIYLLEKMKLSLHADNAHFVIQLLNDDNYLNMNEIQFEEILNLKPAA